MDERELVHMTREEEDGDFSSLTDDIFLYLGEPLDVMKRALLCASTQELAAKVVHHMKHIEYPEDK